MRGRWMLVAVALLALGSGPGQPEERPPADPEVATAPRSLETDPEKACYGLGVELGRSLVNQGIEVDPDVVVQGLRDALAGRKPAIGETELRRVVRDFRAEARRARARSRSLGAEANFEAGQAFLSENARRDGVVTLPSGLQYRVLEQGIGPTPADTDTVQVNYRGRLLDGTEFDSSFRDGEPATFVVKASLPGWRQALLSMPVGSRWELYLPPRLAYGRLGTGLGVGPEATVIFDLELLAIR